MAETLLSFGVEKLWNLLVRESERLGVDEQFNGLKRDLNLLRCFLGDADAKKHTSEMVKICVEEIKEIVFDAEDVIEIFLLKQQLGRTSGIRKRMRRLSFKIFDRRELASDMEGIHKRISKVISDITNFGVQQQIIAHGMCSQPIQERQREMRHTFPSVNESDFVGLEPNVEKLVGYLVDEESIQVVSISGMGGIGKTALARHVFNHEKIKSSFDGAVWVCVSQQFTGKYVWKTILQKLCSSHDEHRVSDMTEDELQDKLFRLLETSKSLIVLDDMWREEDWDSIKHVFPPTKGWKVLLTSRNEDVALRIDPACVTFKPKCLTPEESWTLFQRIAFPKKYTAEMEEMGKKIIKHCGRLPLAVKVLGGLLVSQHTLSEWKKVYENIGSHLSGRASFNDGSRNSVHHVLSLSFEELPFLLKHGFLYLAHYPEDYQIDVEIITMPGYYGRESIRDVADVYVEELVKRNMVMSERDSRTSRFETCQLHDMMREVCLLKAKEENFLKVVHGTSTANSKSPYKSRRLAVHRPGAKFNLEGELKNPRLRSLLCIWDPNWMASCLFFAKLKMMRVLDLCCAKFEGRKLPSNIGKLIHLRYLSLYQAYITHLPSSMRNLKQLLYLNLEVAGGSSLYVPKIFKMMRRLRYLSFPWEMHGNGMLEIGYLFSLETLENFSLEHRRATALQFMKRLRVLSITVNNRECTIETLSSSLGKLTHLEKLTIINSTFMARDFVLDCIHLKQLELRIHMPKLPNEQHFPSHLKTISLTECRLEEDPMPILEKLLHLNEVSLWYRSFSVMKMVCSAGGFPQLQKLVLCGLEEWKEWIVEEGSMPLLHTLDIRCCSKLKELPNGLRFVTSLKDLTSIFMGRRWKERLSEGGEDYYKVRHIPSVIFQREHTDE